MSDVQRLIDGITVKSLELQLDVLQRRERKLEEKCAAYKAIAHEFYAMHLAAEEIPAVRDAMEHLLITIKLADPDFMERFDDLSFLPPFPEDITKYLQFNKDKDE